MFAHNTQSQNIRISAQQLVSTSEHPCTKASLQELVGRNKVEEQPLAMLCRPKAFQSTLKTNANYTDAGWKTEFQALRRVYRYQIGQLLIQPTSKPQQHQISKNL